MNTTRRSLLKALAALPLTWLIPWKITRRSGTRKLTDAEVAEYERRLVREYMNGLQVIAKQPSSRLTASEIRNSYDLLNQAYAEHFSRAMAEQIDQQILDTAIRS